MRKKLLSNTYLRDVIDYKLTIYCDIDDMYVAVKKIKHVNDKFLIRNKIIIDDGYYILEVLPKNENYSMRVFLNEKKEVLEYYFDITMQNGIDDDTKIPYYDDLYLDVSIFDGIASVLDEDELEEALNDNKISKHDYDLAYRSLNKLLLEIENKTNKYMNLDFKKYL